MDIYLCIGLHFVYLMRSSPKTEILIFMIEIYFIDIEFPS